MDWIELTDFAVPCVLGVLDREQREHQTLEIALRLGLDLDGAAGGDLSASVDYAGVMVQVATIVQQGRWRLLESMAAAICRHLLAEPGPSEGRAPIRVVEVRLRKPEVLGGRAVPGLWIRREADWCDVQRRSMGEGVLCDTLQETNLVGAYRIHLTPGTSWQLPAAASAIVVGGRVVSSGDPVRPGDVLARGSESKLVAGESGSTLLVVSIPVLA